MPIEWLTEAFAIMRTAPHVTFLLLTKRAPNIVKRSVAAGGLPANAAIGSTVVTQEEADRDIPHLLRAKAVLRPAFAFLSMEPLMGLVDLTNISTLRFPGAEVLNALTGQLSGMFGDECATQVPPVDWVITGGESGVHARPTHPDWLRSLRDQCAAGGVAYHHKQNGEWVGPNRHVPPNTNPREVRHDLGPTPVFRVGKKLSGRLLDGVLHDAMPSVR